jgi:hypothetical protein
MLLKLSHKAIGKFAMVPNNAGASAIFKLFQARPQLLEKRLKPPPPVATLYLSTRKRKSCGLAGSATEQAAKKMHHDRHEIDSNLPTARQEVVDPISSTNSPTTTLFQEAKRYDDTLADRIESLHNNGDHEQVAILIQQQQEAVLQLQRRFYQV